MSIRFCSGIYHYIKRDHLNCEFTADYTLLGAVKWIIALIWAPFMGISDSRLHCMYSLCKLPLVAPRNHPVWQNLDMTYEIKAFWSNECTRSLPRALNT